MSRQLLIQIANEEIGTKESPAGSNKIKYGAWYGMNGQPWCAMFVSWVYNQAGNPLGTIDSTRGYASCQSGYNHWSASGELTSDPKPGDIVLFDWNGDGHCDHTGIFVSWIKKGSTFNTIEGNTAAGNDSNGGAVMERQRMVNSVKAFVTPRVLNAENFVAQPIDDTLRESSKGSDVAQMQKKLYDLGYKIVVDGDFGAKTKAVVMQYQKDHKLKATGIVTKELQQFMASNGVAPTMLNTGSFLHKGDTGAAVVALQKSLVKKGYKIVADGVFGVNTFEALKKYQQSNGLDADGIAGPQTFAALKLELV